MPSCSAGRLPRGCGAGGRLETLSEAGLLAEDHGKKGVRQTEGKVDLTASATYRRWHERFQTTTFLRHCLTIRL